MAEALINLRRCLAHQRFGGPHLSREKGIGQQQIAPEQGSSESYGRAACVYITSDHMAFIMKSLAKDCSEMLGKATRSNGLLVGRCNYAGWRNCRFLVVSRLMMVDAASSLSLSWTQLSFATTEKRTSRVQRSFLTTRLLGGQFLSSNEHKLSPSAPLPSLLHGPLRWSAGRVEAPNHRGLGGV